MTDSILPDDVANGLVDGTVDIPSLPADLRGVAEVLATAHRPATGAELAGMASAVQQFSAAVTSTSTPAAAIAGATTTGVLSMFGTRITKRAAVIVGATVLFAGTAAAAAGGVLPTPFSNSVRDFTPPALASAATSTDAPESSETTLGATEAIAAEAAAIQDKAAETEALEDATSTSTSYSGRDFGLCTAWTNGATKNTSAPAFADLVDEAAAAGMADVDTYCAAVLLDHDATTSTANSTEIATGSSVDDKGGQNNGGQNNGGQNNGGQNPATSNATPPSVSNPSATAPGVSADDNGGQSGKGKGKGGDDTSTSNG